MGQAKPIAQRKAPNKPVFYLLAGPNGAGKSTLYRALVLAGTVPVSVEFVNADLYEAEHLKHLPDAQARSEQARVWADARRAGLLSARLWRCARAPGRRSLCKLCHNGRSKS